MALNKEYSMDWGGLELECAQITTTSDVAVGGDQTVAGTLDVTGAVTLSAGLVRTGRQIVTPICGNAKVGATAGWVITGDTDICHATLPASQTASTLVVPITGLEIGDTLTGVSIQGQVESAGNDVTLVLSVRKVTTAAGANTDAELGTDNVGTLTADTLISSANLAVTGLSEVLAEGETLYVLLTGTTDASTDIDLTGLIATVTRS